MSRQGLSGLPAQRPVETALTYLPGVSRARAKAILERARIDPDTRTDDLDALQVDLIRRLLKGDADDGTTEEADDTALKPWTTGTASEFAPYLDRVRQMVQRYLVVLRPWEQHNDDPTQNIAPAGTMQTLDSTCLRCLRGEALDPERLAYVTRIERRLAGLYDELEIATEGCRRFDELRAIFGLSDLECDILWVLLAAELVPEFLWLYRALWRDTQRFSWSEDFLAHAADPFAARAAEVLRALESVSALQRYGLVVAGSDDGTMLRKFRAAPFIASYLVGLPVSLSDLPGALWHEVDSQANGAASRDVPLSASVKAGLKRGLRGKRRFLVTGPERAGSLRVAREALRMFGESLLEVRLSELLKGGVTRVGHVLGRARLARAGIFFVQAEVMDRGTHGAEQLAALIRLLKGETTTMFFAARVDRQADEHKLSPQTHLALLRDLGCLELSTAIPEMAMREDLWRDRLNDDMNPQDLADLAPSVAVYKFGVDEIDLAVNLARARARQRDPKKATVHIPDIEKSCRQVAASRLSGLATRVNVRGTWETTVLVDETREVLEEMVAFGKFAGHVLDEQGYGRSMGYGRALTALFSGPSGTGKTLCAGLAARDLGLELFRVDLANVVSKYIGETEERLAQLFDASQDAGIALLFDEADSLFAKRTDVQSSVDRYANLEVNYLLQRLEEHEGLVILTTNFPDSIDTAFMRRIRFKPHFPPPEADERERLWRVMIPDTAPQEQELKIRFVAEDYELTGGQIQNAVVRAAVWAADAGIPLNYELLNRAGEREYKDIGRVIREYDDSDDSDDSDTIIMPGP
jgi:SpoVK/Ycf46/Vps4 family AAA+-type ATPase/ribosomal protein S13